MKINVLIFFFLLQSINSYSQAGQLDSTFNNTGLATAYFKGSSTGFTYSEASSVAVQPDGKIVAGGDLFNWATGFALVRYNADGSLDNSFGNQGKDSVNIEDGSDDGGYVLLQPDGRILLGGWCSNNSGVLGFSLSRFNTDGSIDSSFNYSGTAFVSFGDFLVTFLGEIALQPDGKIVQVGGAEMWPGDSSSIFAIVRYNANGTIDSSFGNDGKVRTSFVNQSSVAQSVAIQSNGKIIVSGYSVSNIYSPPACFAMARYNNDGSLDSSFGIAGKVNSYPGDANPDGSAYDFDVSDAMALQPDGKIILAGYSYTAADSIISKIRFSRYNNDGSLDNSFGNKGIVETVGFAVINSICLQPDGKIIMSGGGNGHPTSFYVIRYNANGTLDSSFGKNGFVPWMNFSDDVVQALAMQSDGKIIAAGNNSSNYVDMIVLRFLSGLNTGVLNFSSPQNPLLIYPNPISKQATLQYTLTQTESISITLTDMPGRQVQTFFTNQQREQGEHKEELQLSNTLAAGNYILSISNGYSSQGVKVTVVR